MSIQEHILRGTFRRDRHERLAAVGAGPSTDLDPAVLARLGAGLEAAGRQLVSDLVNGADGWTGKDLQLVRMAAEAADRVAQYRAAIAKDGVARTGKRGQISPHPLLNHERRASAALIVALKAIDFSDETAAVVTARVARRL